jgi:hypothetical protein
VAYDPALTSFIIVGVVGGVAVVMSAAPGWETSHELARATDGWTAPVVTRSYRNDSTARVRESREAAILQGHGYEAILRRETGGLSALGQVGATGGRKVQPGTPARGSIVITYHLA